MSNLIKDISVLTTIPEFNISKLSNLSIKCISHNIAEAIRDEKSICTIDIGIGELIVNLNKEDLKFKFIPSKSLKTSIIDTINSKESSLVFEVEDILKDKILFTYKNLL